MPKNCKNLMTMLERRRIPIEGGVWVDAYNMVTNRIAGTVKARIDHNNLYFVTELYECALREDGDRPQGDTRSDTLTEGRADS